MTIIICSIQIAIIYMYNARAASVLCVICIATTVITRVRAIDICSSERVYHARYVVVVAARINVSTEKRKRERER